MDMCPQVTPVTAQLSFPFQGKRILGATADSMHFKNIDPRHEMMIPLPAHVGAFGVTRKFHVHEGVDLYCPTGDPVYAMERGIVRGILPFTGPQVGMPWWHDTFAVFVEGRCGVLNYGEIRPSKKLWVGKTVEAGELMGEVMQVLTQDKGRPMSMLHLELYIHGSKDWCGSWKPGGEKPASLRDPTALLLHAAGLPRRHFPWPMTLPEVP